MLHLINMVSHMFSLQERSPHAQHLCLATSSAVDVQPEIIPKLYTSTISTADTSPTTEPTDEHYDTACPNTISTVHTTAWNSTPAVAGGLSCLAPLDCLCGTPLPLCGFLCLAKSTIVSFLHHF